MIEKIIVFSFLMIFFKSNIQAQEKFISHYKIGISKGFEKSIVQKRAINSNIDFMNYTYQYPLLLTDSYTGLFAQISFRNRLEINFQTQMQYHINLKNVRLSMQYFPKNNLGFTAGFYRYEQIFSGFYEYPFTENDGSFFMIADMKAKQRFFDRAIYSGITFRKSINKFRFEGKFNGGACIFSPINVSLFLKQKDNNLIKRVEYKTARIWNGFILPEATVSYDLFSIKNMSYGIELKANSFISNRAVNYNKIIYSWNSDNYSSVIIKPESHFYFRYECDLGLYFKW
jgi:hypothetical protein